LNEGAGVTGETVGGLVEGSEVGVWAFKKVTRKLLMVIRRRGSILLAN
jgi:hypothetical protein